MAVPIVPGLIRDKIEVVLKRCMYMVVLGAAVCVMVGRGSYANKNR